MIVSKPRQYNPSLPVDSSSTSDTKKLYQYLNNTKPNLLVGCSEQFTSQNVLTGIIDEIESVTNRTPVIINHEIYTQQTALSNKTSMINLLNNHLSIGGIVGLHDHPGNPVTSTLFDTGYTGSGTGYADRSGTPLAQIKTGGGLNSTYLSYLDEVANIISSINGPVMYRPFHEINGNWFWWNGSDRRSDMILVWQQTVDYLRNTKGLHNILFVLNFDANGELADSSYGGQALSTWWPGTNYVDIVSLDYYPNSTPAYLLSPRFISAYNEIVQLAGTYNKPIGISEYGAQNLVAQTQSDFWSSLNTIHTYCREIAFICTWNGNYAVNSKGNSATGFANFCGDKRIVMLDNYNKDRP